MRWLKSAVLASLTLAMLPLPSILCSPQKSSFVHQKRYAMGTVFEIVIYDEDLPRADVAARAALDEVVRLDGILSNYKPESNLSRMNRTAPLRIDRRVALLLASFRWPVRHQRGPTCRSLESGSRRWTLAYGRRPGFCAALCRISENRTATARPHSISFRLHAIGPGCDREGLRCRSRNRNTKRSWYSPRLPRRRRQHHLRPGCGARGQCMARSFARPIA